MGVGTFWEGARNFFRPKELTPVDAPDEKAETPPDAPHHQGERVDGKKGSFILTEPLGSGSFGEVWVAHSEDGTEVVIKFLHHFRVGQRNQEFEKRLKREGRALAELNDPHIVQYKDSAEDGTFLVMERLHGKTLGEEMKQRKNSKAFADVPNYIPPKEKINRTGAVSNLDALLYLSDIAGAMAHAHQKGYLHRDIKPDNIFIKDDGTPVIMDFGLAGVYDERSKSEERLTIPSENSIPLMGSVPYMPREQTLGEAVPASDVYSLGVVLYELLAGRRPIVADVRPDGSKPSAREQRLNILDKIYNKSVEIKPLQSLRPNEYPPELSTLLQQMLSYDAKKRPTMAEVQQALKDIAEDYKTQAWKQPQSTSKAA